MSIIHKSKQFITAALLITVAFSCGNEPDKIIYKGPQFVFIEGAESVPLLENRTKILEIPLKVSLARDEDVSVTYSVENNNVASGVDYNILSPNPIVIPAGEYEVPIEIEVIDNLTIEDVDRGFNITIEDVSGPVNQSQVQSSVNILIVNDDCLPEIPKISNWIGDLAVEDVGFGAVPSIGFAGPDGSCGGMLIVEGDLLNFGLESRIRIYFTQDAPGSTTGTVTVFRSSFFVDEAYSDYQYKGSGVYDQDTREILIDYTFYDDTGEVWFTGQHYITFDE